MKEKIRGAFISVLFLSTAAGAQDLSNVRSEKWLTFHGGLGATAYVYGVSGIQPRRLPFAFVLYGNATVTLKGFAMPFSFQYTDQQTDFRQPFNQLGVSPSYKWVRVHLGYRNLSYSRYTLDNHQFLGAGIDLTPGKFRFSAMWGRFLKAVQEDSARQVYNATLEYPVAAFSRYGYAAKIGYGSAANFIDLSYFKGKDDSNSVSRNPEIQQVRPSENAAVGLRTHLTFFKKLTLDADAGISVYTRDQRSDTVNADEGAVISAAKSVLVPRLSTHFYYAGDAALMYRERLFSLGLKYSYILPDYKTMGMYYMQTDVSRVTFVPSYNSKKGTFQANASVGIEHDNLEGKKIAQTQRIVGSANANYSPKPAYGISLQYANYGISQKPGLKKLSDTVTLDQVTQSIIASPRYTLQKENAIHNFVYLFSDQTLNDNNRFNAQNYNMTSINNTVSYSVFMNRSSLGFDAAVYSISTKVSAGTTNNLGGSLGLSKSFFKNALSSLLNASYSTNTFEGASDGSTLQIRTTHQLTASRQHRFRIDGLYTHNESRSEVLNQTFSEYLLTIGYTYSF